MKSAAKNACFLGENAVWTGRPALVPRVAAAPTYSLGRIQQGSSVGISFGAAKTTPGTPRAKTSDLNRRSNKENLCFRSAFASCIFAGSGGPHLAGQPKVCRRKRFDYRAARCLAAGVVAHAGICFVFVWSLGMMSHQKSSELWLNSILSTPIKATPMYACLKD